MIVNHTDDSKSCIFTKISIVKNHKKGTVPIAEWLNGPGLGEKGRGGMIVNLTVIIFAKVTGIYVEVGSYKSPLNIKRWKGRYIKYQLIN